MLFGTNFQIALSTSKNKFSDKIKAFFTVNYQINLSAVWDELFDPIKLCLH